MKKASKIVLLAGVACLAACSDSTGVPTAPSTSMSVQGGGANAALTMSDTIRFSFTIDPSRTTVYSLGLGNSIVFPAGTLCDLSSSYGRGQWDQPCAVSKTAVLVNAKAWLDRKGQARLDFDKHIRFVPSNDPSKWVMLTITDYMSSSRAAATILYCVNENSVGCVDESKSDPSLATVKDPVTGTLKRRIKHFSGYNVFSGLPCDPSPTDPDCIATSSTLMNKVAPGLSLGAVTMVRAGYMLAWA